MDKENEYTYDDTETNNERIVVKRNYTDTQIKAPNGEQILTESYDLIDNSEPANARKPEQNFSENQEYKYFNSISGEEQKKDSQPHQEFIKPKKKHSFKLLKFTAAIILVGILGLGAGAGYRIASSHFAEKYISIKTSEAETDIAGNAKEVKSENLDNSSDIGSSSTSNLPNIQSIVKKYEPAVVSVMTKDTNSYNGETHVIGTGVVFSQDDEYIYIVSNQHVVYSQRGNYVYERETPLYIAFDDNNVEPIEIMGSDAQSDLAVLKVKKENISEDYLKTLEPVTFADSDKINAGEWVVAIGNPLGFEDTSTFGIVSALNRKMNLDVDFIQIDAAINSGNSGGATFNMKGEVIGINSIKIKDTGVEGLGFAISSNDVKYVINEILENGKVKRAYLGITGKTVTSAESNEYQIPKGVRVIDVYRNTGAHIAGLLPGDVITHVDDKNINSMDELRAILKNKKIDDRIELKVFRAGHPELIISPILKDRSELED